MRADFHPDRVPGAESAVIEDSKLLEYALSLEHSVGRAKALFFQSIGYTRDEYEELKHGILDVLPFVEGHFVKKNPDDADNWEAIISIRRRDKDGTADICTVWEVREGRPRMSRSLWNFGRPSTTDQAAVLKSLTSFRSTSAA